LEEELKEGKNFAAAVEEGFRRAWPSIRDGNITTLLVAVILFWFGSSFVQGFALSLSIGILLSMFSAIVVTKSFLRLFVNTPLEKVKWLWR
jgi:preprotein translocase subunit SecD